MPTHALPSLFRLNAAFSLVTGAAALAAAGPIADALGVPAEAVGAVGAGLVGFAGGLVALSRRPTNGLRAWGWAIAGVDAGWVAASAAVLALRAPTGPGTALVVSTSVVVAALAAAQARAAGGPPRTGTSVVEVSREITGDVQDVWQLMIDSELYARLAPNLSKVGPFAVDAAGTPQERRCWDARGQHWDESCTSWRPGVSFSVRVHTDAPDYPYPLAQLQGTWAVVTAGPARSRVTVRFELEPRPGLAGRVFATAMTTTGPTMVHRIITGWEEAAARSTHPDAATRV